MMSQSNTWTRTTLAVVLGVAILMMVPVAADAGLVSHWKFDEGTGQIVTDSEGGNNGTRGEGTGAGPADPTWIAGKFGNALSFDSQNDQRVRIGSDNTVTQLTGSKSLSFWTKLASGGAYSNGLIAIDNNTSTNRWYLDTVSASAGHIRSWKIVGGAGGQLFQVDNVLNYNADWQHVVLADDGTGTGGTKVYVDGQLKATQNSFEYSDLVAGSVLRLGVARHSGGYQYLEGALDDFGVCDAALTAPQVKAIYNLGNTPDIAHDLGQAQQLFDIHDAGSGTTILNGRPWAYATGLSTNAADLGKVVLDGDHYTVSLDASGTGVAAPARLVSHWKFDEGAGQIVTDSAGSNDGTLAETTAAGSSDPTRIDGKLGNALNFDSQYDQRVRIGSDNTVTQLSGPKTIAFWTKPASGGAYSNGFIAIDDNTSSNRWYFDTTSASAGHIRSYKVLGGTATELFRASNVLAYDSDWQHVAVTDDGTGAGGTKVYVDGQLKGTYNSFDYADLPAGSVLRLGVARHGGGYQYLEGALDDFGVWRSALTPTEVKAVYTLADNPDIAHDLGQVQNLLDVHEVGAGSVRHGSLEWTYATGLPTAAADLGNVTKVGGQYVLPLASAGTGLVANAELIAHWKFDEGSGQIVTDSAGSNHGTLAETTATGTSDPTRIAGKLGGALNFVAANAQRVRIGADNTVTSLSGPKTFAFWTRLDSGGSSNGFIAIDDNTSTNRWYIDDTSYAGDIRMWQVGDGANGEQFHVDDVLNYDSADWQHIVVADDGSGTNGTRIYVDGQHVATRNSFDYSGLLPGSVLRLGACMHSAGYRYLNGDLDDFGVWRTALAAPEVKALYNVAQHPDLAYDLGQAQQLFNIHDDQVGTTRVNGRYWLYRTGLSTNPADLGHVAQDGDKFTLTLSAAGTGVVAPGTLVAHWTFDDGAGTTVTDARNNAHGTLQGNTGAPTWSPNGVLGGSLDFQSSDNQFVDCGTNNAVTNLSGAKTIAFWTKMQTGSPTSNAFIGIDNATSTNRWYIDTDGSSATNIRMWKIEGGAGGEMFRVNNVLAYNDWVHVALTDDGTGTNATKIYVNGQLVGTRNSFDFAGLLPTSTLRLGAGRQSASYAYLEGELDDFGIWSVALTQPQTSALYQLATSPSLAYDLGIVQQLFDLHAAGPGGGNLLLNGYADWQYADGLTTDLGMLTYAGGQYSLRLDANGTGLVATIPEPATLALLAAGCATIAARRRRKRRN